MAIDTKIKSVIAKFDNNSYIVQYNDKSTQFIAETSIIPPLLLRLFGTVSIVGINGSFTYNSVEYFDVLLSDNSNAHIKVDLSTGPDAEEIVNHFNELSIDNAAQGSIGNATQGSIGNVAQSSMDIDNDDNHDNHDNHDNEVKFKYYPIEAILKHRKVGDVTEYLVKWEGNYENSWCPEQDIGEYALINYQLKCKINSYNSRIEDGRTCYFYIRTSQKKDIVNADTSIDLQTDEIFKYVESRNYRVCNGYVDNGRSAKSMSNQAALYELLNEIKDKNDCIIVIYNISRFSRCLIESLQLIEALKTRRIYIEFASELLTTEVPGQRQLIEYKLSDAQALSQTASLQSKEFIKRRKDAGLDIGRIPYGMKRVDGKNIPDEAEGKTIEFIKSMKGTNTCKIIKILKKKNITYRSKDWSESTIHRLLALKK
jgi:DNA invertase Pin-like site-specific DNA recombinase